MKKRYSLFGKQAVSTTSDQKPTPDTPIIYSSTFQSIHQLPLFRFVDCLVDNNFSSLIIPDQPADRVKPTDDMLQLAWADILAEYSDAIGTEDYKMYVNIYREIAELRLRLDLIGSLIQVLQVAKSDYLAGQLNKLLKFKGVFNWEDQNSYQAELLKASRMSKSIRIKIDLKVMQFEAIQKKYTETNKKADRGYYQSMLISLSDQAKFEIQDTITVFVFCERVRRYNLYIEQLNKKAK